MLRVLKAMREQGCGHEPCLDWERREGFEETALRHEPKDEGRKPVCCERVGVHSQTRAL